MNNRIVITGPNGFIGSHLIKALMDSNYNHIYGIDIKPRKTAGIDCAIGSFDDSDLLGETLQENDIVIHLACTTVPATSELNKKGDLNKNVLGSVNLMKTCVDKKVHKLIFFSSGGTVYGDHGDMPISETAKPSPISAHGLMKLAIENEIIAHHHLHGLNYVILRPSNPYGCAVEIKKNQGIIDVILSKAINNEPIDIWGDGTVVRDYIYIDDLTHLVTEIIKQDISNTTLNAGTGIGTSINAMIDLVNQFTDTKHLVQYKENRYFDIPYNILNIEKSKKLLNWKPQTILKAGIEKSYTISLERTKV